MLLFGDVFSTFRIFNDPDDEDKENQVDEDDEDEGSQEERVEGITLRSNKTRGVSKIAVICFIDIISESVTFSKSKVSDQREGEWDSCSGTIC